MKILMLMGGGDVGGAKTHILSLCLRLAKYHEVKLVSFRAGDFPREALELGVDVEIFSSLNLFKVKRQLNSLVKDFKPDIVHSHGTRANFMSAIVKNKLDIPTVTTVHSDYKLDYLGNSFKQSTFGVINALSLRTIDNHVAVADTMQNLLIKRNFNPNNIMKIYNGIDFKESEQKVDKNEYFRGFGVEIGEFDVVLGIAARLTEVKDIKTLLKAFEIAYKTDKNIRLVVAGNGEDLEKLQKLAEELGIFNRVHFIGWITDVSSFFQAIDINLLTSISETFPYSLLEGILEKTATITSEVGGVTKMIDHEINGYIFKPRDFETLARYILEFSQSEDKRKNFAELLYNKASIEFSLDRTCSDQVEIYEKCIDLYGKSKEKRNKITICGAYGKGNAGDDAILRAIVSEMRQVDPNIPLCVMSRTPILTKLDYLTNSVYTFNIFKFAKCFLKSKVYINGGGSLIQDITSSRSLYFYLFTLLLAKKLGAKVMMYGCGIGPVNGKINRKIATKIINDNVDVITLRDEISLQELKKMGVYAPKIKITADPTMNLSAKSEDDVDKALKEAKVPNDLKYIGIGVRKWKDLEKVNGEIAKALEYAYEKHNLVPIFLPIEYPSDIMPAKDISEKLSCPNFIVKTKQTTETTIGLFARMNVVLGIRLHSLIFSASNGVPVIGMSYDIKVNGFLKYINSDACINLEEVSAKKLYELIDLAVTDEYKEKVSRLAVELKEKEYENIIEVKKILDV